MRRIVVPPLVLVLFLLVTVLATVPAQAARLDFGKQTYNILPPGQAGSLPPDQHGLDRIRSTTRSPRCSTSSARATSSASSNRPASSRAEASNAVLVGRRRSATGHPLAVMGPQLGFYYPELFLEVDAHGGGIDVRGTMLPGVPWVLIGRTRDYAWTATTAQSDNVDQFVEELCTPDGSQPTRASTSYRYKGRCRPMTTFNAGVLKGSGGSPDERIVFHETVHGPVSGTVTVDGKPHAVANMRSTRGREALDALFAVRLNQGSVRSVEDFARVMNKLEFTFNFFYIDYRHIAFFSTGRLPVRAPGANPASRRSAQVGTTGAASSAVASIPKRSTRAAGSSSTGTTSLPRASVRRTPTGAVSRCIATTSSRASSDATVSMMC